MVVKDLVFQLGCKPSGEGGISAESVLQIFCFQEIAVQ
jgi:hypothetical protein